MKPFIGSSLSDVNLIPGQDYNVTMYFGCYRDEVNNGQYLGTDTSFSWDEAENYGCRPLKLENRQEGIDHLVVVGGEEQVFYNPTAVGERQVILALLDGSIRLAAAAGALLGAATVLI